MPEKEPLQSLLPVFDSRIPEDYAIRRALQQLNSLGYRGLILPRLASWEDHPFSATDRRAPIHRPSAWVRSDDGEHPKVYIADYGKRYKEASKGNENSLKSLAGIIAHEDFHNKSGYDEGPAYDKQLEVLESLRAPRQEIKNIQKVQSRIAPAHKR